MRHRAGALGLRLGAPAPVSPAVGSLPAPALRPLVHGTSLPRRGARHTGRGTNRSGPVAELMQKRG
ncbi:hypothetical protein STTU_2474 [Streptomyces sp. Tu6071]|nr:hypothetical protein STTU_2474 [Streptomyces sp. Tu6071]